MSDKQLTVAELLARASKDSSTPTSRTRRRRRSLEEGGISVAELTGSIPRVDKTPEQPRHTAQPLDADTAQPLDADPAADSSAPAAQSVAASQPDQVTAPEAPAPASPAPEDEGRHAAPATTDRAATRKTQDDHDTMVLHVVKEGDPVRFTTDTFPAVSPEQAAAASADDTAEPVAAPSEGTHAESAATVAESTDNHRDDVLGALIPDDSRFSENGRESRDDVEHPARQDVEDGEQGVAESEEHEDRRSISLAMVVAMTVVAVVIGAAIFKGFQMLWGNFNHAITAVLAVAVTAAIVGIVHALRTERDKLSMVVAGVVGLVLTFGPSLIVGI